MAKYSLIKHVARGILFGNYRKVPVVVLSAYFDASGNKRSPVLTIAGFVSTVNMWDRFQKDWPIFLSSHHVNSLHMTDFVTYRKEFKSWKGPEQSARRRKFIERAVTHVKRNIRHGFATSLVLSDYESVNAQYRLEEYAGPPYVVCAMMCLNQVTQWAKKRNHDPKQILYFVEDGDEDQGILVNRSKRDGYKVVPIPKTDACAFQACDMAAWKMSAGLRSAESKRSDFDSIVRSMSQMSPILHENKATSREKLILLCQDHGIKRRNA